MMKWIAAATAVCALVLMAVACVPDYPHDLPQTPKAHLLATSLLVAYRSNPVRFDLEHKGDQVRARGRVHKIDPDGAVWFQIGAIPFMVGDRLVCVFENRRLVANLDQGDERTVAGRVHSARGSPGSHVRLVDCRLAE